MIGRIARRQVTTATQYCTRKIQKSAHTISVSATRTLATKSTSEHSTFNEEWARKPPSAEEKEQGGRIEFTVKIPKPIRPFNEPLEAKRARLLWSVRKRGILECDLLLSTFITKDRLAGFSAKDLQELDDLLEENDWDVYYWTTGAKEPPAEVKAYGFWNALFEHSKNKRKDILRMPDL